jgi:hypothetical protein
MSKKKTVKIPMKEFVKEHKKLLQVLRSPSRKDDKREADEQEKELDAAQKSRCWDGYEPTPGKKPYSEGSCRPKSKAKAFVKKKMKKSIDFKETTVSVDSTDQMVAEKTTNPKLIEYIKLHSGLLKADGSVAKIPFPTGILTLSQREAGLYHGHFQDRDGQIVEKFDSQTVEIISKMLELKSLVPSIAQAEVAEASPSPPTDKDLAMAAHDRIDMVHNRIDALERQSLNVKGIKIKYGEFELEIRKSVRDFVNDFKLGKAAQKDTLRKAITSWRKKHAEYIPLQSDQAAAKELLANWEQHEDSFCQFVDALTRMEDEDERS